ncbi:MobA/MobL family protein [Megamonas funiformis]|uniref:MobA/MobL family protein n=2 Tax=Megamonas funiformis TaxID=437897 RepID=UPI002665FB4F|nr:MobA/MobL family protein [Megamonas funiformis]
MAFYHCSIKTSKDKKGNFIPGKKHADYINREGEYKDYDNKVGLAHAEYINREKDFARQEFLRKHGQCVYKANKLPKWAKGNPSEFFKSADVYGRKNKASYREFELALQEELTLEQNIEIVNTILNNCEYFQDKYYAVAIHDKQAALDSNKQQIHCHIMVSDKMIDDIEKTNERPPEQFFKTYCRVNTDKGGAKVDRYFSKDNFGKNLTHFRKYYCDVTNAVFRKYGIDKTIDHKSLKMQREEALRNGDYVRAEILNRPAEQYIGTIASYDKNDPTVQKLLEKRAYIAERTNLILAASETEKNIKDTILIDKINSSIKEANDVIDERCNTLESKVADISILKNDILFLLNQIKETSKDVLSFEEAKALAKYDLMTKDEKALTNKLLNFNQKSIELQNKIVNTDNDKIRQQLDNELEKTNKAISALKVQLRPTNKKFTQSAFKAKVTKKANYLLLENAPLREKLELLKDKLDVQTANLKQILKENIINLPAQSYSAKEVKTILDNLVIDVKNSLEYKQQEYKSLTSRVISPQRAREMAYNVATNHKYRELKEAKRLIAKEKIKLEQEAKPLINQLEYVQKFDDSYSLNQVKQQLQPYITKYHELNVKEQDVFTKFNELEVFINAPEQQEKINSIIEGILTKNSPIKYQCDSLRGQISSLKIELKELKNLSVGVNNQVRLDKNTNFKYSIKLQTGTTSVANISGGSISSSDTIKLLAQAFNGVEGAIPLVAKIDEQTDEVLDYKHLNIVDKRAKRSNAILKEFS